MGNILKVLAVVIAITLTGGGAMAAGNKAIAGKDGMVIRSFDTLYEPSAVVSLPGGNVMMFEDDGQEIVTVHRLVEDKEGLLLERVESSVPVLDIGDVEGAALGRNGTVVAMSSHSPNKKGKQKDKREQLLYFSPGKESDPVLVSGKRLKNEIVESLLRIDSSLKEAAVELNIEGLSFTADGNGLLIGLRAPVYQGKAIIMELTNPYALVSKDYSPQLSSKPILQNLGGSGVRAMTYDSKGKRYLVASEVKTKKGNMRPRLWSWQNGAPVVRAKINGLKKLKNIEGMTVVQHKNNRFLLLVCDDGNKKKGKGASYTLVNMEQVRIVE